MTLSPANKISIPIYIRVILGFKISLPTWMWKEVCRAARQTTANISTPLGWGSQNAMKENEYNTQRTRQYHQKNKWVSFHQNRRMHDQPTMCRLQYHMAPFARQEAVFWLATVHVLSSCTDAPYYLITVHISIFCRWHLMVSKYTCRL